MINPNSKVFQKVFKDKKRNRIMLFAELLYAVILAITVIYDIPVFCRLLTIQFIGVLVFLAIGWFLTWRDKKAGRIVATKKDHTFFLKTFMEETPIQKQKAFFRTLSFITVCVSFIISAISCEKIFVDLASKIQPGETAIMENMMMYADTFYVFTMAGIMLGLLFGKKRLTRNASVASAFLSLVLFAFHPGAWLLYLIGLVVSGSGYLLYRLNQL